MKKYLFIINPVSGKGRGKEFLPQIENFLNKNSISHKIILTEYPKHATAIAEINQKDFDFIISVGGDGTLNEIINGVNPELETTFAEVPLGSGNDFAHNLGIPDNIQDCLTIITSVSAKTELCDLWQLEFENSNKELITRRFINNFGLGFDAQVAYIKLNKKIGKGIISYIIAVLRALLDYKLVNYTLSFDDIHITGSKVLLTFGNGVSSGGGFYLTPNAKVNDGLIDITTLDSISRLKLLQKLPLALMNKVDQIKEANFYKTNRAEIKLTETVYIHTDGEANRINTTKISVSKINKGLKFITNK